MRTAPPARDLSGVIEHGLCIGCGACVFADPSIELELDADRLTYRPSHAGDERAAAVCPAVQVDFDGLQESIFPGRDRTPYGVIDSVMLAQSTNHERNLRASSGGLIKELMHELLDSGEVDGVIALTEIDGVHYEPRLHRTAEQIEQLPGSIYHAVPLDNAIRLLKKNSGRFVVTAIPCQLEGLYQYIYTYEPLLAGKIHSTIGLLCGWLYSHHALRAISRFKGIDYDSVTEVSYRGGGPVGALRLRTPEGETKVSRRVSFSYQVAFDRSFNTTRCHLCVNHNNFLADVVVGDAWLPSTVMTRTGISLVINRKPEFTRLLSRLADDGRLRMTEVTTEEIKESMKPRVAFGNFAYAYADWRKSQGLPTPEMEAENRELAELATPEECARFHAELMTKQRLQALGRYRLMWARKATVEFPKLFRRYWEWFTVRILKIKSLKGERQELPREQVAIFE